MYTGSQWAMHEGMTHVQCTQKHLPCRCHCKHQMNTFHRKSWTTKSQRSSWGATIEVLCNNPGSNPITAFVSCNPPRLDQTKVRNSLLHIVQFWLGDDAASHAVFEVLNLLLHAFETLFQVKLLKALVINDAVRFPNQDILTSKTHLHKIMFISSIETNRVKRTRKHLRRCRRSKRRWTFQCPQTRNQHRFTTTNPKPIKIHVCLKQFFRIFTDLSFQLFSVGISFPFKPSGIFNLRFRLSPSGLRCWYHFFIIDLFYWYLNLGHYYRALRREFRFNTSFLSPLFLKLWKTFPTCLVVSNTRCFHATLTCWTSTGRFKTWHVRWNSFRTFRTTNGYICSICWWRRRWSDGHSRRLCWNFLWSHGNVRSCQWHCWCQTQLTRLLLHTAGLWQDIEKWLLHKAKYVKTSAKFSCENMTSNPCAFRSALSTEKDSFNSLYSQLLQLIDAVVVRLDE